jgi:hypothetical protein
VALIVQGHERIVRLIVLCCRWSLVVVLCFASFVVLGCPSSLVVMLLQLASAVYFLLCSKIYSLT